MDTKQNKLHLTKPAILLFFLAPAVAELLGGSSPPLEYFRPLGFIFLHLAYGSVAVLIREWAIRNRLGGAGRVVSALAMGVYIEGLFCKSFFSPEWADFSFPLGYARWLEINWHWAIALMVYHALMSVMIPWLVVDLIYPDLKDKPALGRKGVLFLGVAALLVGALGFFTVPMNAGGVVFIPPVWQVVAAIALVLGFPWVATKLQNLRCNPRFKPSPAHLGWLAAVGWIVFLIIILWMGPGLLGLPASMVIGLQLALIAIATLFCLNLHPVSESHIFAFIVGNSGFFIVLGFIAETDKANRPDDPTGMALVSLAAIAGLLLLARHISIHRKLTARQQHSIPAMLE